MADKKTFPFVEKLVTIQSNLKAPKGQHNKFGNYNYRSCEDILEAVKPLLNEYGMLVTITDSIVQIGERYYISATAKIEDGTASREVTAYAREDLQQKGMSSSQITGSASSYARKYALNGLFLIDDTRDADATNQHGKDQQTPAPQDNVITPNGQITEDEYKELQAQFMAAAKLSGTQSKAFLAQMQSDLGFNLSISMTPEQLAKAREYLAAQHE